MPPGAPDRAEPSLSVVIPLYRESRRLPGQLPSYRAFLDAHPSSELLLVDDGSGEREGTPSIARAFAEADGRVRFVQLPKHLGKGAACRAGIAAATGEVVLLSDCDLSTPLEEYDRLAPLLSDCDLIIGSRRSKGAQVTYKQPLWRRVFGRLGRLAVRSMIGLKYRDTQCGFKLLGPACRPLVQQCRLNGAGFDFELLLLAERARLRIAEQGVRWADRAHSRFSPLSFLYTCGELLRLKLQLLAGNYGARARG